MNSISFIGNSEPPDKLLDLFKKMTPGCSGVWGQLKGESHYNTTYHCVIDYLPQGLNIDQTKCIFLGAHPPSMQAYRNMDGYTCLKKFDCRNTLGFLEWWLKYDYDYLSNLSPTAKTKELCCIISNADSQPYHIKRREYLERFCSYNSGKVDVYGRIIPTGNILSHYKGVCGSWDPRGAASANGNDHMSGKEEIYSQYKYALEFDAPAGGGGYFSERIADSLLMWCSPIYWGCEKLAEFLPPQCFSFLNIDSNGEDVISIMNSNLYQSKLPYISEARNKILNELQIWPRVHNAIFGTYK